MVHAARRTAFEKTAHRRGITQRLEQLDPGVWQLDEDHCDTVRRQRARLRHAGAEYPPIELARGREIGHDDCHVIEPSDHRHSPQIEGLFREK